MTDYRASNLLWQGICSGMHFDELSIEVQQRILEDAITKYYNHMDHKMPSARCYW